MTTKAARELELQVAGHKGVQTDDSGELVFKPALPTEIAFYTNVQQNPALSALKPFTPVQYGTLILQGEEDGEGGVRPLEESGSESIVLENLTYGYTHPSVLDAKLGTVLYDEDASDEKKQRMIKKALETTTGQVGLRFTGCQTWHHPSSSYIATPRQYGYDLTVSEMAGALARFFPLPSEVISEYVEPADSEDKKTSESQPASGEDGQDVTQTGEAEENTKKKEVTKEETKLEKQGDKEEKKGKEPKTYTSHALPPHLLRRLLRTLLDRLSKLRSALSTSELRAVGSSLLIVYEGDPARLSSHFSALDEGRVKWKEDEEVDDASSSESEDEEEGEEGEEGEGEEGEEGEGEGQGKEARLPVTLHLIDFAHTVPTPGRGADEGVLMGLDHFTGLVRERLGVVEALEREGGKAKDAPGDVGTESGQGRVEKDGTAGEVVEGGGHEGKAEGQKDDDDERETKKIKTT